MFRFIRVTNQNIITLFEIGENGKDDYSHYHLLMRAINSDDYGSMRIRSAIPHVYGAAAPANNLITNVFTNLFWKDDGSQTGENFVLFRRKGKSDLDDNRHIVSLTVKDVKKNIK